MSSDPLTSDNTAAQETLRIRQEGSSLESDLPPASSTPLSTPPREAFQKADEAMAGSKMPPPAKPTRSRPRKRSHAESDAAQEAGDSSETIVNTPSHIAAHAKQTDPTTDPSTTTMADTQSEGQQAKQIDTTNTPPQKVPRSGQGSQKPNPMAIKKEQASQSIESVRHTLHKGIEVDEVEQDDIDVEEDADANEQSPDGFDDSETSDQELPELPLRFYDWHDLQMRYHENLAQLNQKEEAVMTDFSRMINVCLLPQTC